MAELAPGDGPRCDARQGMCVGRRGSLFRITRPLGSARGQGGDVGVAAAVGRTNPAPGRGHIGVRLGGTERSRARTPVRVGGPGGDGHAESHDRDAGTRSSHAAARSEAAHRPGHAQAARQFAADAPVGPRLLLRPRDRANRDDDAAHTRIAAHARAWRVRRPRAVTARLRAGLPAELRAAARPSSRTCGSSRLVPPAGAPRPRRDGLDRRPHPLDQALHGPAARARTSCSSAATRSTPTTSTRCMMLALMALAAELIGVARQRPAAPVEQSRVDQCCMRKRPAVTAPTPDEAARRVPVDDGLAPRPTASCRSTGAHFPAGRRLELTKRAAQFTSQRRRQPPDLLRRVRRHVPHACGATPAGATRSPAPTLVAGRSPIARAPHRAAGAGWSCSRRRSSDRAARRRVPRARPASTYYHPTRDRRRAAEAEARQEQRRTTTKREAPAQACAGATARPREFLAGLPKVRRALANVPTYMIFDDHDVTDDWFLNPMWRDRVLTTSLGGTIAPQRAARLRAVPGLGQRPAALRDSGPPQASCSTRAAELFPDGASRARPAAAATASTRCSASTSAAADAARRPRTPRVNPPIKWHFTVDGPKHRVDRARQPHAPQLRLAHRPARQRVGVDAHASTRSRRRRCPAAREVLLVIAPLQVIGPPVLDELVAPADLPRLRHGQARQGQRDRSRVRQPDAVCAAWPAPTRTRSRRGRSTP